MARLGKPCQHWEADSKIQLGAAKDGGMVVCRAVVLQGKIREARIVECREAKKAEMGRIQVGRNLSITCSHN